MSEESMQVVNEILENEQLKEQVLELERQLETAREVITETRMQRDAAQHEERQTREAMAQLRRRTAKERDQHEKELRKVRIRRVRAMKWPAVWAFIGFTLMVLSTTGMRKGVLDMIVGEPVAIAAGFLIAFCCGVLKDRMEDAWQAGKVGGK